MATSPLKKLIKTKPAAAATEAETVEETTAPAKGPATKTVVKKATAAKAPAAEAVEAPEATSDDLIVKIVHEVENLKEESAFKLVPSLMNGIDQDNFKLGGVLAKVQAEGWFMNQGQETFRAWVEATTGLQYRKAIYLIQIYNHLSGSGIAWDKVKNLGWTKLKELSAIMTPENVDEWVAYAESVTVLQLIEAIKTATKGESAEGEKSPTETSDVTTMTFKFHKDQKSTMREALDKAKHQSGTEHDSVAIEQIALDYLGGASPLKAVPTLLEMLKSKSIEDVLQALDEAFPNVVIQAALYDTPEEAATAKEELQAAAEAEAG